MRRRIGIAWAVVGALSFVLSLPSVRGGVAAWAEWLESLQGAPWQWVFISLGLAIIAGAYLPQIYRRYRPARAAPPMPGDAGRRTERARPPA